MKLNYDSWFCKYFLQLSTDTYARPPQTICALGRLIVGMSFLWLIAFAVSAFLLASYVTGIGGLLYVLFTDNTFQQVFQFGGDTVGWMETSFIIFIGINVCAAGIWAKVSFTAMQERREIRKWREEQSENYVEPETPVTDFFKGVWARIHDKTCTMIEWDNTPSQKRRKQEEEREAQYKQYLESLNTEESSEENA